MANYYEGDGEEVPQPMDDTPQDVAGGGPGPGDRGRITLPGDDSDSSEEEGQAFYAGGSTSSGQQVVT